MSDRSGYMELDNGKLFVGGISWGTNEDSLKEYFQGFGEVVEAVIMKDRTTGRARGFGFVVFADPLVAERVVMQKHMIDGRMVEAKKAVPRDDQQILGRNNNIIHGSPGPSPTKKIFVGGLPSTVTENDFRKYFEQFGTITDVVVMYDHNTQRHRGFGFITYGSEDAVDKALINTFHELNGKMVEVKRAVPKELSPGPSILSPINAYNIGLNRVNGFLNGYTQGYNSSMIGNYGMRMDGRYGQLVGGRNGFPSFNPGYGIGLNIELGMSPSYGGGNSNFGNTLGYPRPLSPYGRNSSRYNNTPIEYAGGNDNSSSILSASRSLWGNNTLNYANNSTNVNSYMNLGPFGNGSLNWDGSSRPILENSVVSGSGYNRGNPGYGNGENSFNLGANSFGRSSGIASLNRSLDAPNNGYEGNYTDAYGGSSIYRDSTWRSTSSEFDVSDPFGYGLGNAASDVTAKNSAGYVGDYSITNRQMNRGIVT